MEIKSDLKIKNEEKNELNLNKNKKIDLILEKNQNNFINNLIGKAINTGLDIGIRAVLPDIIEEQVISIKNNLLNYGLKDGISKTIEDAINLGKSTLGIITGDFESVSQMNNVIKNGGILDNISDILDLTINKMAQNGNISPDISKLIKQGKKTILNSIESNIDKSLVNQQESAERLEKALNNWKTSYNNHDFKGMEKEYKKVEKELCNLVPIENIIKEARNVENLHTLVKTNGQNFNLSETEQELLKKMT